MLVQNPHDHPVKRSLTPLHRRGISWYRTHTTTPSGFARHPSRGGEWSASTGGGISWYRTHMTTPSGCALPPLHRRGISWYRTHTTTPSGYACHPSTGGELAGTEPTQPPRQAAPATPPQEGNCRSGLGNWKAQAVVHHPVGLRPPPLQRRGMVRLHRRGICWYRTHTTIPSGEA